MRDEQLSINFNRSEFACPGQNCCGGAAPVDMRLIALLQKIRDAVEAPITVSSGFRCPKHNAAIGGVPDSYHTLGHAADIYSPKQSFHVLYMTAVAVIRDYGYGHVIPYAERGFVHVDIHSRARD